jgi:quercetin dioxygenase-like cupin family protein
MGPRKLAMDAESVAAVRFEIPGASGEFRIQLLNQDAASGVVTSIIHLPPGGRIPAHCHQAGSEMHYVLEGDMIEAGKPLGPGAFLTHAAGQVHGPHESRGGAKVLTVQSWQSSGGDYDFEPAEATEATPTGEMPGEADQRKPARVMEEAGSAGGERKGDQRGMHKVDERTQEKARRKEGEPGAKGYS